MPAIDDDLDEAAVAYAKSAAGASATERIALRDRLTEQCLPFAGRLARRYRGRGEPLEDLEQVARLGLIKAVDRYDPDRGSFTAYAVITITGELKRHFRDHTWGVRAPRRVQDLRLELARATALLTAALARAPTATELARRLEVSEQAVLEAMAWEADSTVASLNAPVDDSGHELSDLVGGADHELDLVDDRLTVAGLLMRLPARERRILALRFYGNRTQSEIAAELGISQMHVSRLLSRALSWLREAMLCDTASCWDYGGNADGPGMRVWVTEAEGILTVHVSGEVDRDTAGRLRTGLWHAVHLADPDRVVVDLSGVPLIDAAGMAVLAESGVTVAGARPYVARTLAMAGLR
jgi:RNA polymerase sigma-B factor